MKILFNGIDYTSCPGTTYSLVETQNGPAYTGTDVVLVTSTDDSFTLTIDASAYMTKKFQIKAERIGIVAIQSQFEIIVCGPAAISATTFGPVFTS